MSQLMNAEVNSGNSSTSNYTLQLRIRECHAGMKCDLKVTKHYSHCVDPENIHTPPSPHPTDGFSPLTPHPTPWNFRCGGSLNRHLVKKTRVLFQFRNQLLLSSTFCVYIRREGTDSFYQPDVTWP